MEERWGKKIRKETIVKMASGGRRREGEGGGGMGEEGGKGEEGGRGDKGGMTSLSPHLHPSLSIRGKN